uniref:Uncharacterized protein n=1 Tax=Arundo donax TaxID=35708 RepID=A0A0A9HTI7_ARUDO
MLNSRLLHKNKSLSIKKMRLRKVDKPDQG